MSNQIRELEKQLHELEEQANQVRKQIKECSSSLPEPEKVFCISCVNIFRPSATPFIVGVWSSRENAEKFVPPNNMLHDMSSLSNPNFIDRFFSNGYKYSCSIIKVKRQNINATVLQNIDCMLENEGKSLPEIFSRFYNN